MTEIARRWRVLVGGGAAAAAGVLGFAGTTASAEPVLPPPPPGPATVTQTVTVTPNAAAPGTPPQLLGQPAAPITPAAAPARPATPAVPVPATNGVGAGLPAQSVKAPRPLPIRPATSGTLADYFESKGVRMEPQVADGFTALNIVLPLPRGWAHVPDPNVPDAFAVIADRVGGGLYTSNAQLVVYKLVGDFDPLEAISHAFVDAQRLPGWRTTDAAFTEFGGFPSALIEGTYQDNSLTLNTSRRHVIATSGADRYLVSLSVTTSIDQVVPAAEATDAIARGFRVSVPTPASAPPPSPGTPPPPAPPAMPQPPAASLGLSG
ncbi:putative lipoLpqN family protein [Mycolicibacterium hassiacum DSM 44199]|jgi:hypothetical protein|uniref:Putative lipoLpqN family protein n=2 Tax=Mycolicibacterium hassiacum TaxID=46351 RepID=K5BL39_MYCHD|nr:LpqN/LpqT family lipoprotein [Mycolicibacterium hassiacum]EKF25944.1 putative lipoLpqN family protein [Mycolicibacterium hassiacum DSM 44199]MDA4088419.1 hypothetical protein [Mycolicibacterium hassiacum DSM 44199]PZN19166.1 MAG: hypothetical protein DIU75_15345 [Mycolicibacterium hassiacum]